MPIINEKIRENLKPLVFAIAKDRGVEKLEVAIHFQIDSLKIKIECYNPEPFTPYCGIEICLHTHHELPAKMIRMYNSTISKELYNKLMETPLDSYIEFREEFKKMHKLNGTKSTIRILYEKE